MEIVRSDSELLALIQRIADKASAHATILERVQDEDKWTDSFQEYEVMLSDLRDALFCLSGNQELCVNTEVWSWLYYQPNDLETYYFEEF